MTDVGPPKSVMVTGGCGFIASNFINHIGHSWPNTKIINFDKLMPGANAFNIDKVNRWGKITFLAKLSVIEVNISYWVQ